jgi:BASS family bile acid:Na+ symporter
MEALQALIPMLLTFSLAGLVLAVGLNSAREDLLYVLTRPRLLYRAAVSVLVVPPLAAGLLIAFAPPLPAVAQAGIMLMAISPVPPLVPGKELAAGGRKNYAYGLYVAMVLLTVVSVPLTVAIATTLFERSDFVSVGAIARMILIGVLAPLALGLAIRAFARAFALQWWTRIYKISMVLVLLAFIPIVATAWPAVTSLVGNGTVIAMALVTVISLAVGHVLGGPNSRDRATLAIASSVRHPGIAMSIAAANFSDPRISAAILLFLLVGMVVSAPYIVWMKRHPPSRAAHA